MKPTIRAKIGTHAATVLVLWKEYIPGDSFVIAMEQSQWECSHWSYRRLRSCSFWKKLWVDKENSRPDFLFLSR